MYELCHLNKISVILGQRKNTSVSDNILEKNRAGR
jgi:hypothetical protein